ncbi:non-ribosomal peptide synthetase, partial [Methylobacterium sp. Leaf104]|uniref:non-ribosomal peptide synthetase n=2 Tax=Methylobacterium TaxID=407 RepID=UPI000ACF1D2B
ARPLSETEAVVARIWAEALGLTTIHPDQNFFEAGGDSILSLQIVARLREAGFAAQPRQIFAHQSVAALARVLRTRDTEAPAPALPEGPAPLTPIQAWFLRQDMPRPDHWNQSLRLTLGADVDGDRLADALRRLPARHEALRTAFRRDREGAWTQAPVPAEQLPDPVARIAVAYEAETEACFRAAERGLDLARGRVFAAILAVTDDGPARLLLTAHHLVVDAVSWRILLTDLEALYRDGAALAAPAVPFRAVAHHLGAQPPRDPAPWIAALGAPSRALPVDHPDGTRRQRDAREIRITFDAGTTAGLDRAGGPTRPRLHERVLTGIARAVAAWAGGDALHVTVERHGRDAALAVERTVGWFTTLVPVRLALTGDRDRDVRVVKEALRGLPGAADEFGRLRELGPTESRDRLAALPVPALTFNHLGTLDGLAPGGLFSLDAEDMRLSADPDSPLGAELTINSYVRGGSLTLRLAYAKTRFAESTIGTLSERIRDELAALASATGAPGLTPSDVPLAGLDQDGLDRLGLDDRSVSDLYPLAPAQAGILFHALAAPGTGLYVNQLAVTIAGLDAPRFVAAWRAALARHPILRCGFLWTEAMGAPLQVVHATAELPVAWRDLRTDAAPDLGALAEAERAQGFDLARPPLMRLLMAALPDGSHHLIWTCHHLLLDGWSNARLVSEVLRTYAGEAVEPPHRLFREHVAALARGDSEGDAAYWREALAPLDEPSLLAPALAGEAGRSGHGLVDTPLDRAQVARLQAVAPAERVTLATLFEAAWALTLARFTNRSRVAFGVTVSGRPADDGGMHAVLGLFINTVPRCIHLPAERPVGAWLRELQDAAATLRDHALAPLVAIQGWAGSPGRPLFDSLLVVENYPVDAVVRDRDAGGLRFGPVTTLEATDVPLTLSVLLDAAPRLTWSHDRARIGTADIDRLAAQMLGTLAALVENAQAPLGSLDLVPEGERRAARAGARLLAPAGPAPAEPAIHRRIAAQAQRRPQAIAVTCAGADLSYGALDARAARLARHLVRAGVRPGALVGLCAERSLDLVVGLLAILKSGAGYLPLDPGYPADRLAFLLADSGAAHVLVQGDALGPDVLRPAPAPRLIRLDGPLPDETDAVTLPGPPHPDQPAYVIYTSGSTGQPKGVVITHANVARLLETTQGQFGFGEADVWTLFHAYGFDFSVWEIFGALCHGGRLVVVPRSVARAADAFLDLLVHEGVTVLNQTPSAFRPLMQAALARTPSPPLALRTIVFGGEALDVGGLAPWFARFGDASPRLVNMYGITETTVHVTSRVLRAGDAAAPDSPIGEALDDLTLHLLDDALDPVPDGVPGEIHVGGAGLASGYLGRPGLTAARFVPDPHGPPGARLYRSGDRALRRPDGSLAYLGRADGQVKLRGYRIETGEVAAALRAEPEVADAAVILRAGPGGPRLLAYVVPADPAAGDLDEPGLRARLLRRLPEHMVPAGIVALAALPLTANGKLDTEALPEPARTAATFEPPEGETERAIAQIWCEVLGLTAVARDDNFFGLGGHSLSAAQVTMRIGQRLATPVPIRTVFEAQTLRSLARAVEAHRADGSDARADLSAMDDLLVDLET